MSCESCADARDGRPHRAGSEVLPVELLDLVLDRERVRAHVAEQIRHREGDRRLARRRDVQRDLLGGADDRVEALDEAGLAAAGDGGIPGEVDVDRRDLVEVAEDERQVRRRVLDGRRRRVVVGAEEREVGRGVRRGLVDGHGRGGRTCDERSRNDGADEQLLDLSHGLHEILAFLFG